MTSILRNKNCLITGASGGLGSALARQLAKSGCNLFLVGRNTEKLLQLSKEILEKFSEISVCYSLCDLSNAEEINESASEANDKFGSIDILINSAGTFPVGDVIDMSADDFNYCFDVNVRAPFQLSKLLFPGMKKNKWGRVINIGSSSSYNGFKGTAAYCASKHALLGLSRSLYSEWKEFGIRVLVVSPGSLKTEMGRKVEGQDFETFIETEELASFILQLMTHDDDMIVEEVRVNRVFVQ